MNRKNADRDIKAILLVTVLWVLALTVVIVSIIIF